MIEQNYQGYLLAAHPKRSDPFTRRGVILVLDHSETGAIGLQINKPFTSDVNFETVMNNIGLSTDLDYPLYNGGQENQHRIHVVHSMDWYSSATTKVTEDIGVSHDISVLTAISAGRGPVYFKAVAGHVKWAAGNLEGEVLGEDPWDITHSWSFAPATSETVFDFDEYEQWHSVITESSKHQIASWF